MTTKNHPGVYEPIFVLWGRDSMAPTMVRMYGLVREALGEAPAKIAEIKACAESMDEWLRRLGKSAKGVQYWVCCIPLDILADELRRRGATVTPAHDEAPSAEMP